MAKCDCGLEKEYILRNLTIGTTKSCGCHKKSTIVKLSLKHGFAKRKLNSRIYRTWRKMKERCENEKVHNYHRYGGRGITVCDEWKNNFQAFYDWAMANGYQSNLTIDRKDNNGNYEPDNCRWATNVQQARNRANTKLNESQVESIRTLYSTSEKTQKEIGNIFGVSKDTVSLIVKNKIWV